jgi:hypothetical protein
MKELILKTGDWTVYFTEEDFNIIRQALVNEITRLATARDEWAACGFSIAKMTQELIDERNEILTRMTR